MFPSRIYCNFLVIYHSISYFMLRWSIPSLLGNKSSNAKISKRNRTTSRMSPRHKLKPGAQGRNEQTQHLLISVAMIVMLCHTLNSLSSGVASVIFPSSALMLNCLSRSVCRSMENLQNRHICNLLQCLYDLYIPQQTFSNP